MCLSCCSQMYQDALSRGSPCDACRTHNQRPSSGAQSSSHPSLPPTGALSASGGTQSLNTQTHMLQPLDVTPSLSQPQQATQATSIVSGTFCPPSQASTQASSSSSPQSSRTQLSQASELGVSRRPRSLAMPIAPQALQQHHNARRKADESKSLKQERLEIQERLKRTCELVLYYEV